MSGGVFHSLIGGDEDPSALARAQAAIGGEALASAISVGQAGYGPGVQAATERFLEHQSRLLEAQLRHSDAEHRIRLALLKGQRAGQVVRFILQIIAGVLAAILLGSMLIMIWYAAQSRAVVVDAFEIPPGLAQEGMTGRAIAQEIRARFDEIRAISPIDGALQREVADGWRGYGEIQLSEGGISLGDLYTMMRRRLGHDTHVGGMILQHQNGRLALTIAGDNIKPKTFAGDADSLDALEWQAAEYAFGEADPAIYASYLAATGRVDEALAFDAAAYARVPEPDKHMFLWVWGNDLATAGRHDEAKAKYESAAALRPDFAPPWTNLIAYVSRREGDEAALHFAEGAVARLGPAKPHPDQESLGLGPYRSVAEFKEDWSAVHAMQNDIIAKESVGAQSTAVAWLRTSRVSIALHDIDAAEREFAAAGTVGPFNGAWRDFTHALLAFERSDLKAAVQGFEAAAASANGQIVQCQLGRVYSQLGRFDDADAAFVKGSPSVQCAIFRAEALDAQGRSAEAFSAFAESAAKSPSLPAVYHHWGAALLAHGELEAAAEKFALAHERGPHWADPIKGMGDVLRRQGRFKEAVVRYDEALKYAPAWPALREAREITAAKR